ncbi:UDP-glucose 4-epimerase GalE [Stutzerimonas stutzeri]|uniref:UDP-glucose 4-epimerase n=1 Tax=Stutzerimonas stutzeri TaxID=316 RepID=A0A2N8RFW1_STUST|nr:UDP-glucose 4-epimerase GalE [Stutzerimonas stutzeri]MCQ4253827.1 UDP-glucose 4-epimerase GalE [Stutzerimonas stutzeri]PNF59968.1 UDP-glucose 4-epimerase GalE [Stutzerimonas stutzeri]
MLRRILVTGGAGYIGSHATLSLLEAGFDVLVLDNLSNSSEESLRRVSKICGKALKFVKGDIRDRLLLDSLFADNRIDAVLHFAGLKSVCESIHDPLTYYENNIIGTLTLCQSMASSGVFNLVFSSSAAVYGDASRMPISEDFPTGPKTPYGRSKLMAEEILRDLGNSESRWRIALLRYFNPVGAHSSGLIGEDPNDTPSNLLPYISQVAIGKLSNVAVFGNDYPTRDGTGVRDYIHVVDLAEGHIKALNAISQLNGVHTWNLGTGTGYTVLEMINAFGRISGLPIPHHITARRAGDIAECWANSSKAEYELKWTAKRALDDMVTDAWRWQTLNPLGYKCI